MHQNINGPSTAATETVRRDAANRALRTLVQNLLIDVLTNVYPLLNVALTDAKWTRAYWFLVGTSVGKTAALTVLSYLYRLMVPPKVPTAGAQGN